MENSCFFSHLGKWKKWGIFFLLGKSGQNLVLFFLLIIIFFLAGKPVQSLIGKKNKHRITMGWPKAWCTGRGFRFSCHSMLIVSNLPPPKCLYITIPQSPDFGTCITSILNSWANTPEFYKTYTCTYMKLCNHPSQIPPWLCFSTCQG